MRLYPGDGWLFTPPLYVPSLPTPVPRKNPSLPPPRYVHTVTTARLHKSERDNATATSTRENDNQTLNTLPCLPLSHQHYRLSMFFVEGRIWFLRHTVLFGKRLRQASVSRGHSPDTEEVAKLDAKHVPQHVGRCCDDVQLRPDELWPRYFPPVDCHLLSVAGIKRYRMAVEGWQYYRYITSKSIPCESEFWRNTTNTLRNPLLWSIDGALVERENAFGCTVESGGPSKTANRDTFPRILQ